MDLPYEEDASYVRHLFDEISQARQAQDIEAYNNFAALYGYQWSEWSNIGRFYVNYLALSKDSKEYIAVNKLKSIMKARAAFIIGQNPTITIEAESPETEDKEAAYIAQRVARADWEQNNLFGTILRCWEWVKSCGIAFIETYYDPGAGKYLGRIKETGQPVFEGQVKARVLPKFCVFWDPLATCWDEVQYAIVGLIVSRETLERRHDNIDFRLLDKDEWAIAPTQISEMIAQLERPELVQLRGLKDQEGRRRNFLILKYYERPSRKYPEGRYIVTLGRQVLRSGNLLFGEIPLTPFMESTVAGTINGQTPVTEMRPIQELLNRLVSLDYERSKMPDIYAFPSGAGWPKRFGQKAVIVGEYRPGLGEPKFVSAGISRQDYHIKMRLYEEWMENIAGVSSISARATTKHEVSGRMGYIINEANRALLADIAYHFRRSVADLIRLRLRYMSYFYTDERIMSYINEEDRREVVRFTGKDIGGNWAVTVRFTEIPTNPDVRSQRILQLFQNQIVVEQLAKDPVAMRKALIAIDPEIGHYFFVSETDTDVARDENYAFSQGEDPAVMPWHNDEIHSIEHKRQLDSDTIRKWDPENVRRLQEHWLKHQIQLAAKMRERAMMQALQLQMARMQQAQQGLNNVPQSEGTVPPENIEQNPIKQIDQTLEQKVRQAYPGYQPGPPPNQPTGPNQPQEGV